MPRPFRVTLPNTALRATQIVSPLVINLFFVPVCLFPSFLPLTVTSPPGAAYALATHLQLQHPPPDAAPLAAIAAAPLLGISMARAFATCYTIISCVVLFAFSICLAQISSSMTLTFLTTQMFTTHLWSIGHFYAFDVVHITMPQVSLRPFHRHTADSDNMSCKYDHTHKRKPVYVVFGCTSQVCLTDEHQCRAAGGSSPRAPLAWPSPQSAVQPAGQSPFKSIIQFPYVELPEAVGPA